MQNEKKQKNLFFRTFFFGMCCTAFFRCTPTFRERYLQPATKDISNKKDEIIEHIYIKYLKGNQYIKSFKELPRFEGITGAGHSLHMPYLLWITREICNKLGTLKI
ncbi:MAG: hypothetical protein LBU27_09640 [Candidatus Peribacteria bacterium]|nr:hypothetical protein [Candidatus Peribacteria bacterium]